MNLKKITPGKKIPKEIYVVIEISAFSTPVKYEIDKNNQLLMVDRIIPSPIFYPCNYGFINKTLSLDGDALDALVITPYPLHLYSVIACNPIGILNMEDESGKDCKILCIPTKKICSKYNKIKNIYDISISILNKIEYFFKYYKKLEHNKWTKILGWKDKNYAYKEIIQSIKRYKQNIK